MSSLIQNLTGKEGDLVFLSLVLFFTSSSLLYGQEEVENVESVYMIDSLEPIRDTSRNILQFSGMVGLTNNGFSIVPSFSLNSPAVLAQLSWRKKKFSIDPDIRLTPDARKGSMIFWLRYHAIQKGKWSLRTGVHPSFLLQTRTVTEDGIDLEITQMRRFIAWELAPNYQITNQWSVGLYYLQGNAMQSDGPQTTHFITLNTSVSNIKIGGNFRLRLIPAVYYLNLDGYSGQYLTATGVISHTKLPFTIQSDINKTFTSDLPGNKDFLWNVSIRYIFGKDFIVRN